MRAGKTVCLVLALLVSVRAEAGNILSFDENGVVTARSDPTTAYNYGKTQIETSGLMYKKLGNMGYAPDSAVSKATISGIEEAAVGAANGARAGFGGGWIGIVAGAVIGAVVQTAIALGIDKLVTWLFGSGNTVTTATTSGGTPTRYFSIDAMFPDNCGVTEEKDYWTDIEAANAFISASQTTPSACYGSKSSLQYGSPTCDGNGNCTYTLTSGSGSGQSTETDTLTIKATQGTNAPNMQSTSVPAGTTTTGSSDIADAASAVPATERSQPLSPDLAADTVDSLWQTASQQAGYTGVPYDPTNPITSTDATNWAAANPSYAPTVGDGLGYETDTTTQGLPGTGASIGALPATGTAGSSDTTPGANTGTSTSTGTGTGTGTGTSTGTGAGTSGGASDSTSNLCSEDPSAAACASLGSASSVAVPASSVAVGLSPWSIGPGSAVCPAPIQFEVFGQSYSIAYDPLCTLAEKLSPLVAAVGGLLAAMIVLAGVKA